MRNARHCCAALAVASSIALSAPCLASSTKVDLHKLSVGIEAKGKGVVLAANTVAILGFQPQDVQAKEINVNTDRKRGITIFNINNVRYLAIFDQSVEDVWMIAFKLDGTIIKEQYGKKAAGFRDVDAPEVADSECEFWEKWIAGATPFP